MLMVALGFGLSLCWCVKRRRPSIDSAASSKEGGREGGRAGCMCADGRFGIRI
jgi:hypothetical protein